MSAPTADRRHVVTPAHRLTRFGRSEEFGFQQVVAAVVAIAAVALFLLCGSWAGAFVSAWWYVFGAGAGLVVAVFPDTVYPLGVWAALGFFWVTQVPGPFSWWSAAAALLALVTHCVSAMSAARPTTLPWPRAVLAVTVRRLAVVAAITLATAGAAGLVRLVDLPGSQVLLGAALLVVAVWAWAAWRTTRTPDSPPPR